MAIFNSYVSLPEGTFIFHFIWIVILPIDELIFFIGVETTNQIFLFPEFIWACVET